MGPRRILLIVLGILLAASLALPLGAQELPVQDSFTGRGIAKISSGEIESARQQALIDAQRKAVMAAVTGLLPFEAIEKHFVLLKTNFFNKPATYIQSFKILHENTLFDTYQITIQALIQPDLLRKDLETKALGGSTKESLKVLLMIAEKGINTIEYIYWWSSPGTAARIPEIEMKLKEKCTEKGLTVIDPVQTIKALPSPAAAQTPEPDIDTLSRIGAQCGADIVIAGKAEMERSKGTESSSFSAFQCNVKTSTVSVKDRRIVISAASYGLGVNTDESTAYKNAIDKACGQMTEQIVDKLYILPLGSR